MEEAGKMMFLQTKRFDVFRHRVERNPELGLPRDLYTAWSRLDDIPRPLCEVTIFHSDMGNYVEWVHVCQQHRRQGIATEVLEALREKIGDIIVEGTTDEGDGLCESLNWE
jgi:GNAT superfamily N-acetyltransferase